MSKPVVNEVKLPTADGQAITIRYVMPGSYRPNPNNTNQGQERGDAAIRKSMGDSGWFKAISLTADDTVTMGNHAYQAAEEEGVVKGWVEVDLPNGNYGVATKRMDWSDARVPQAIKAAIIDNRTQELNYKPAYEQLLQDWMILEDADLGIEPVFFTAEEVSAWDVDTDSLSWEAPTESEPDDDTPIGAGIDGDRYPLAIVLNWKHQQLWQDDKDNIGVKGDKSAFLKMWAEWREMKGYAPLEVE
jgi:hypothetical protein